MKCFLENNSNKDYEVVAVGTRETHKFDELGKYFPQMNYMGLDFVATSKNEVKILEINSLTSLDAIQLQGSILKMPQGEFFKQHLKTI